jgi:glycosyltransferase involved in cell wall biosynthesis
MKKIAIVGTNGLPGRYGGWDQLLEHLTLSLNKNYEIVVYTSSFNAVKGLKEYNGARLKIIPLKANGFQSVLYDGISMFHAAIKYDVMLVLGTSGCIFLPLIKLFRKKVILNPDGAEWKRGKWNIFVKWFLKKSEDIGIRFANYIIADNKIIFDYIQNEYGIKTELIAYGGDNAVNVPIKNETLKKYGIVNKQYAFKVCRIEPENNIDLILEAFKLLEIKLILIGNWNFSSYGSNLKMKYSGFKNLILLDPIYHQQTLDELRSNCGIYIHGHSVGGTNPSLVEAMNLGLCCVVYDVNYNRETTENKALYFKNSEELCSIVLQFINSKIDVSLISKDLLAIAKKRYTWDLIVNQYTQVINKCI